MSDLLEKPLIEGNKTPQDVTEDISKLVESAPHPKWFAMLGGAKGIFLWLGY